ncbi:hypothetical protein NQ315_005733 [Exocentrus adspersus]|uniref:Uncharacterized protein n=1 Tax=Exocentrus adspersus TaxID=1586481 RepID=A0AAV8VIH3_9CUCU|nr:hypothetical protein NQ315_005733 [Exocentrus adspersus]
MIYCHTSPCRLRPQTPRYKQTWDPGVVLKYLATKYPNTQLTLLELSKKLTTLLLLVTGHRLQTIHLSKMQNIVFSPDGAEIFVPDIIKTSQPSNIQPCLQLPFYDKEEICVGVLSFCDLLADNMAIQEKSCNFCINNNFDMVG